MPGLWPLRIDQNGRLIKIEAPGIAENLLILREEVPLPYPESTKEVGPQGGWDGENESSRAFCCFPFLPEPAWSRGW